MAKREVKHRMTQQDKEDWDALYWYVHTNVMGYDEKQSLTRDMILRLKGLLHSKFMANNNTKDMSDYSYELVLITFKFCLPKIQKGFRNNSFTDEMRKFNYAVKIVENNLNNVYIKLKNAERAKQKFEESDISEATKYVNLFKPRKVEVDDSLDDLW